MFQNSDETTCSAPKRRMVAPRDLYKSMYPLEQFSETNEGDEYYPELGEELFYRLNPALNKGTAYMTTGHWRRGVCRGRSFKSGVGHLYAVKDIITGTVYELNRYQIQRI
ncbi:MAG: hypothetical protein ABW185_26835 [Sedimenticola sp.]